MIIILCLYIVATWLVFSKFKLGAGCPLPSRCSSRLFSRHFSRTEWLAVFPEFDEPAMLAEHRIGLRHSHFRNRLQRLGVIFRRRPRDLHRWSRRIGADNAEIIARRDALMPGAGGQDRDVAGGNLERRAGIAAEPHSRIDR